MPNIFCSKYYTYYTGGKGAYTQKSRNIYRYGNGSKAIDIKIVQPRYWYIENPRGVLENTAKQLPVRHTYGLPVRRSKSKPTDIWTNINNPWFHGRYVWQNGNKDCHHQQHQEVELERKV